MRRITLVSVAATISLVFLWMVADFLVPLLLAALAAGLLRPIYKKIAQRFRGKKSLAAAVTIALLSLFGVLPLAAFGTLVGLQVVEFGKELEPDIRGRLAGTTSLKEFLESTPSLRWVLPYREQLLTKLGDLSANVGGAAVGAITAAASQTATFFLMLFVMLYATFFFLIGGREILSRILYYLPLPPEDEDRLVSRFVSVARATLKGTLVVGLVQGALGGLGFWVAGIGGAAVWATAMAALSILPGIGTALIWVPGVIYLFAMGRAGAALALLAYCVLIVSTVDNVLRPWLVGKDTKMSDLLVLIATLGGIALFGVMGFVIGPIVAALFVTIWEIYGEAFQDVLPEPSPMSTRPSSAPPSKSANS
ncbi:MAG TPA: AI-2E family transporter [Polyangiaceae bacterium]